MPRHHLVGSTFFDTSGTRRSTATPTASTSTRPSATTGRTTRRAAAISATSWTAWRADQLRRCRGARRTQRRLRRLPGRHRAWPAHGGLRVDPQQRHRRDERERQHARPAGRDDPAAGDARLAVVRPQPPNPTAGTAQVGGTVYANQDGVRIPAVSSSYGTWSAIAMRMTRPRRRTTICTLYDASTQRGQRLPHQLVSSNTTPANATGSCS